MTTVRENMERANLDVIIPRVIPGMVTKRVLVMEFIEGFKVTDAAMLEKHKIDVTALLRRICQAGAQQLYIDGMFNADPHPGNILVNVAADGRVRPVLLDFGLTKKLDDNFRVAFAQMVFSASRMDMGSLLSSFDKMGVSVQRPTTALYNSQTCCLSRILLCVINLSHLIWRLCTAADCLFSSARRFAAAPEPRRPHR